MTIDKQLSDAIDSCKNVIDNNVKSTRYTGKIYRNTNEILSSILRPEQIKDKDVLSVMASSDQVFSAYYLGAKSVDTFDANLLAYYYFFLKKWNLLSNGTHYIPADNKLLEKCLSEHDQTIEEKRAYIFWKEILKYIKDNSLYYSELFYKGSIWWNVPYQNDIEEMKTIISKVSPSYSRFNIYEPVSLPKQYDVIILSNILEYLYEEDEDLIYYEKLNTVVRNLLSLLKPEGIVISSNILDYEYANNFIFEKYFEYKEGPKGFNLRFNKEVPLSYTYKKKQ